jgi:hypothetical protein
VDSAKSSLDQQNRRFLAAGFLNEWKSSGWRFESIQRRDTLACAAVHKGWLAVLSLASCPVRLEAAAAEAQAAQTPPSAPLAPFSGAGVKTPYPAEAQGEEAPQVPGSGEEES